MERPDIDHLSKGKGTVGLVDWIDYLEGAISEWWNAQPEDDEAVDIDRQNASCVVLIDIFNQIPK